MFLETTSFPFFFLLSLSMQHCPFPFLQIFVSSCNPVPDFALWRKVVVPGGGVCPPWGHRQSLFHALYYLCGLCACTSQPYMVGIGHVMVWVYGHALPGWCKSVFTSSLGPCNLCRVWASLGFACTVRNCAGWVSGQLGTECVTLKILLFREFKRSWFGASSSIPASSTCIPIHFAPSASLKYRVLCWELSRALMIGTYIRSEKWFCTTSRLSRDNKLQQLSRNDLQQNN